ncbi:CPBP family glutamic-type intramembrane protease [Auraticoccus monumenti]|uniref:CAAX protease self-immunity n=1 Tax=Auraticoccus monumenti TaxID=675864 RepID=A0A1G6TYK2_9ACTN|nr:CPBP family glutamic-type intramembrane protease [Auraticoccus monumenti]SDD33375.1 CAAX protease self-immunity [Auraticoccus monumenti]
MQRTNAAPLRAAVLLSVLTIAVVTALCAVFLVAGWTLPSWVVVVGRWIPALVSLLVLRLVPLPGGLATWWALRPAGWRRFLTGAVVSVGVLLAVYLATAVLGGALGIVTMVSGGELLTILLVVVPIVVVYSLSTFGEEAAWRGHLQRLLAPWGFWRASVVVAAVWVVFHLPLHGTFVLQGTLPPHVALSSTLLLLPLGLFLSAVVTRFGSVWPAVLAHALPMSALNLVQDPGGIPATPFWIFSAISAVLLLVAAVLLAPRRGALAEPAVPRTDGVTAA